MHKAQQALYSKNGKNVVSGFFARGIAVSILSASDFTTCSEAKS
jgi:hypothetical protein